MFPPHRAQSPWPECSSGAATGHLDARRIQWTGCMVAAGATNGKEKWFNGLSYHLCHTENCVKHCVCCFFLLQILPFFVNECNSAVILFILFVCARRIGVCCCLSHGRESKIATVAAPRFYTQLPLPFPSPPALHQHNQGIC